MATYNANDPYVRQRNIGVPEGVNRPSTPKWVWPVVAIAALALLGLLFSRGMNRPREMPAPTMDHQNEPMRSPDRPMQQPTR